MSIAVQVPHACWPIWIQMNDFVKLSDLGFLVLSTRLVDPDEDNS